MAQSAVVGLLRVLLTANTAEFNSAMKSASDSAQQWSRELRTTGRQAQDAGLAITKIFAPVAVAMGGAVKVAMDFESSFAGVRKTVNASEPEFAALAQGMRDLSKTIPINVNELNRIGEAAGQLGIQTQNILGFTDVMAKLGVTTNLSAEEAASSLARLANITQMPQENFDRLGSTVVDLGNNFATTEREIVDFGLRIAGAGKIAGLAEHQILAIGSAMSSVGVEAEAGGTAVQKVLNQMTESVATGNDDLQVFAETAKMSAAEFAEAFRKDAGAAFASFVSGLGTQGDAAFATLDKLSLGNERVVRAFLSLANAGDLLTRNLNVASRAWRENTALSEEAARRFETTHSQLTILWNRIKDVAITFGNALLPAIKTGIGLFDALVPVLEVLGTAFAALPGPIAAIVVAIPLIGVAAGGLLVVFGQLALAGTALAASFTKKGIATRALTAIFTQYTGVLAANTTAQAANAAAATASGAANAAVATRVGVLARLFGTGGAAAAGAAGSVGLFGKALAALTSPLALVIGGLGLAAVAIYKVSTAETELETSLRENEKAFKDKTDALKSSLATYDALKGKQNLTKEETLKLEEATKALAAASGVVVDRFKREEEGSDTLTAALRRQLGARQDLLNVRVDQLRGEAQQAQAELEAAQERLRQVQAGEATALKPVGPGGAMVAAPLTPSEELNEFERLTNLIEELGRRATESKDRLNEMKGASSENVELARDISTAEKAAAASADWLAAAHERLTEANLKYNQELKGRREALAFDIRHMKETGDTVKVLADRYKISAETVSRFKSELEANTKAVKTAEKASEQHAKQLDKQREALEKLGIVTEETVNEALNEFATLQQHAVDAGVPFNEVLARMVPHLEELHQKALRSGVGIDKTAAALKRAKDAAAQVRTELTALVPTLPVIAGLESLPGTMVEINAAGAWATAQAGLLANAFKFFGVTARSELQKTAREAETHYRQIVAAVGRHAPEAVAAYRKMVAAQKAASGELPSFWAREVMPGIVRALSSLRTEFSGHIAAMLVQAESFKDGFLGIWDSIKRSLFNVFAEIVDGFIKKFLGEVLKALARTNLASTLGGLIPAVATGTGAAAAGAGAGAAAGAGGGGAAGTAAGAGAGIGAGATIALTGGIAAGVILAWGIIKKGWLRGGEEALKVNPARDEFIGQFGPPGTGPGSGFANLQKQLSDLGRLDLFEALLKADTVKEYEKAVSDVAAALERQAQKTQLARDEMAKLSSEGGIASHNLIEFRDATRESAETMAFIKDQSMAAAGGVQAFLEAATVTSQAGAAALGGVLAGAFGELRNQGLSAREALQELGPTVQALRGQLEQTGFSGGAAFDHIAHLVGVASGEIAGPALNAINGLSRALAGAQNAGFLTQDMFKGLVGEIMAQRQAILDSGASFQDVNSLMQRELQTIWQLQRDFNFEVDDATQTLLDEAEAAGTVGDQYRSAMDRAAIAMERVADALESIFGKAKQVGDELGKIPRQINVDVNYSENNIPRPPSEMTEEEARAWLENRPEHEFAARGGIVTAMGRIRPARHMDEGGLVRFKAKGTDTVPAMLTPGEGVVTTSGMNVLGEEGLAAINAGMNWVARGGMQASMASTAATMPAPVSSTDQRVTVNIHRGAFEGVLVDGPSRTRQIAQEIFRMARREPDLQRDFSRIPRREGV